MISLAIAHTWQPFVLVVGLLLIGHVAARDGLFEAVGSRLALLPGGAVVLFVAMMLLAAIVTAVLNLDTSVVFLTPVLLHTARRRDVDETAFLYGSIFMANAASLLLLGSNLTNVLVFARSDVPGAQFTRVMLLPWLASVFVTIVVVMVWRWRALTKPEGGEPEAPRRLVLGPGLFGVIGATVLMLIMRHPALAVLGVALAVVIGDSLIRRQVSLRAVLRSANLPVVVGLFTLATAVSVASSRWHLGVHLLRATSTWQTTAVAAGLANVINNLPAASMLSATAPAHPYGLLLGLNLGPNLTVLGALSSVLWLRVARSEGAPASVWTFTKIGAIVTVLTLVASSLPLQ